MLLLRYLLMALALCLMPASQIQAQTLQDILQTHADEVANPSRRSVGVFLDDLLANGNSQAVPFLEAWRNREIVQRDVDGLFFRQSEDLLFDLETGSEVGSADEISAIRPNGGVRRVIGEALVQFQLLDPDITKRIEAVDAIARAMEATQLEPLAASIDAEPDPALKTRKQRLNVMLIALYGAETDLRVAAIGSLSEDISIETRAVLNTILQTSLQFAQEVPEGANVAGILEPGQDLTVDEAYTYLVEAELADALVTAAQIKDSLIANISDGQVSGTPVGELNNEPTRISAYQALASEGLVPALVDTDSIADVVDTFVFFLQYEESDAAVTNAATEALNTIESQVAVSQAIDLGLDGLSLASIYFLAAIGLAITFGVMGVINMAHGEFIMLGAYTGYVVQIFVPNYTLSILIALPLAFAVTFGAGVTMERLVIRHLYHRPLETLLATFGISIALQQLAKNIFGTQARPLTSPAWLDGALVINDVISISYIRIAIFVLALIFLALIVFILKRTRLGLEVRAVTQNSGMAASMGINPDRINMLTFGLGSGIAGIAGVAIGLYAKVTSEMGSDYIVQSFMTVVVGGVGNVWGTLAGAGMIGGLQKVIEWMNPSNTLAAQTYMILFIILFIQFRPKGIVAPKGRAAAE
ncbi:urea ABC transporter permease subunit UrtB [Cognatiyoonia sp.]|uniref:urea ABC transporter permease subunit UrtB n=1 Tax=Cognatiyoonia sp. TaxID=2211652 RepID=UPI003F69A13A